MSVDILKKTFGYDSFRPGQADVVKSILDKKDVLVLMPTGAGKSICFQVPAIMSNGVTVVISPLISLIYDQVEDLRKLGVCAYFLNSTTPPREIIELNKALRISNPGESEPKCKCKLLYTTPETITNNIDFQAQLDELYENMLLEGFVIDEAHCVSNWGHDFRPGYLELKTIKEYYSLIPIWAFTATATNSVQLDIVRQLSLEKDYDTFCSSFIRKNLSYQIYEKTNDITYTVKKKIKEHYMNQTGIVYCLRRADCEEVSQYLIASGIEADYYHAAMPSARKERVQQSWLDGKIKVIVATIAFALGINKPDVRFVIHTAMPNSLESYYQETGRAGRDGKNSDCILYYNYRDRVVLEKLASKSQTSSGLAPTSCKARIGQMYSTCQNRMECIKQQLSNYLGEYISYSCSSDGTENMCRNCKSPVKKRKNDYTIIANNIREIVGKKGKSREVLVSQIIKEQRSLSRYELNRIINQLVINRICTAKAVITNDNIIELIENTSKKLQKLELWSSSSVLSLYRNPNSSSSSSSSSEQGQTKVISMFEDDAIKKIMSQMKNKKLK